jgi:hypothetical protein
VRKVIPTLTSKSAEIYLSMAGAKQHNDKGLSWFRPWAVRPVGVRSGRCIAVHRGACRGGYKQGGRGGEASRSLRFLIEAKCKYRGRMRKRVSEQLSVAPCGQGITSSFYRQRGGGLQSCHMALVLHMAAQRTVSWS